MLPVTVVIVTYNSAAVIADCLASVVGEVAQVIVVDNNSSDTTGEIIQTAFPQVEYRKQSSNIGFGCANNLALAEVDTPYALLLNPDAVMQPGALIALLEAAARYPEAAILAPRLYDAAGQLQHSYKADIFTRDLPGRAPAPPLAEGDVCADFLSGAVMVLHMQHMRQVGFFDPAIFLYYEDDDICLRVRQHGYGLVWVSGAAAVHLCGQSSPATAASLRFKNAHITWSRLYLEQKYHGRKRAIWLALRLVVRYGVKSLCYLLLCNRAKTLRSYARMRAAIRFPALP